MIRWLALVIATASCTACATAPQIDAPLPLAARAHPDSYVIVTVRNDSAPVSVRAGSTARGYEGTPALYAVGNTARAAVHELAGTYQLQEVSGWPIPELGIHCVVFQLPAGETVAGVLPKLKHDSRVESVQPLNVFTTRGSSYNDPYQKLQANLATMDIEGAHRWSRGAGVDVAVVDTGADTSHPDLAGRIVEQQNFVDADELAFKRDRHGTAVAGVIAADSDNRIGIVGVAPEARLHIYKTCWQTDPASAGAACNTFTLAKGLAAAINARVEVVNLSLAGPADSLLTRLVVRGQERGIIFVGAAPQSNPSLQNDDTFPTGIEGVLKVAANGQNPVAGGALRAPGVDVLTLAPEGRYDFISGNSLATAGVTGAVALLVSRDRNIHVEQLAQLLAGAPSLAGDSQISRGVNACAALATLLNKAPCEPARALPVAAE